MGARRLLLTGATGYLGRALLACLTPADVSKVTAVLRAAAPPDLPGVSWTPYRDILEAPDSLAEVDIVCHLGVPRSGDTAVDLASYVGDLRRLLVNAADAGVSGFILASSQAVYGVTEPIWREDTPLAPVTPYGWAKLAGEQLACSVNATSKTLRCISLRLPKLVGPGARFRMDQGEWVHRLAFSALHQRKISLSSDFLKQKFDFMDVRDAADVLRKVLKDHPANWPKVLNIGTGLVVDGASLAKRVNAVSTLRFAKPLTYSIETNSARTRNFGMSVSALKTYIGTHNPRSLDETIADTLDFLDRSY